MQELLDNKALINDMLARYGVRFGIYKNGNFKEQLFPFDAIPRVIPADQFATFIHSKSWNVVYVLVIDPYEGDVTMQIVAPTDGIVFFAHNEPLVLENTVVFKVIRRLHK